MKIEQVRPIIAEEVRIEGDDEIYLRLIAPGGTRVEGLPIWYTVSLEGWMALGQENFQEQEAAYERMRKEKQQ